MPQLSSFATTASNVSTDNATRTITISSEVVEIDGALDPPTGFSDWGGWTILCNSSGGFRSTSGASGTLGGGTSALRIVEANNGHRFGGDNFNNSNGANARFAGDATNVLKYHNIVWIVESGGRSDFDIGRGTSADGSTGCKVELSGVALYQQHASGGSGHFNHYSGQASIVIHDGVGYGLRVENRTNGPAIEFSTPIHSPAVVEGLVIANVTAANNNNGSRAAVRLERVAENGTMTLSNLNTPSIANVNAPNNDLDRDATKRLLLIDPVGRPSRADWSGRYHGNFEIQRTVPFAFTGVDVPASTTIFATHQGTGVDSTGTASGSAGSVVVRTDYSAHQDSGSSDWSAQNQYKFYMVGYNFQKYAVSTTQTIANNPATITGALTPDVFPDGSAVTSMTTGAVSNAGELYRALKTFGVQNRLEPSADESLVTLDSNDNIVMGSGASVHFSTIQSDLVAENSNVFTVKVSATDYVTPAKGINSLNLGSANTADASVVSRIRFPYTDSTGTSSLITIAAPTSSRVSVFKNDGTRIGTNNDFTNDWELNITATDSLANTRIGYVATDAAREIASQTLDLSSGGSHSVTFLEGRAINDPLGTAILSGVTAKTGLVIGIASSGTNIGRATLNIPNSSVSVKQALKGVYDEIQTDDGCRFAAFGRQLPSVTDLAGQTANLFLGPDCQLRRGLSVNNEAAITGFVFGGIGGVPTNTINGGVTYIPQINTGGGGGGATAQQIWEYSARTLTSDAAPSAADVADAVWSEDTRTLTTSAAPSASDVADEVWARRYLSTTLIPSSVDNGSIVFDADDRVLVPNLTAVKITNLGGYTGPSTTDTYIVADDGAGRRPLYRTRDDALANQIGDRITFAGAGTAGLIRVDVFSPVAIEMTYDIHTNTSEIPQDVWLYATRELTNTSSLATSVATGVWTRTTRTLSNTDNIWSNTNAVTNSGIADAVWAETERTLTAADNITADIADAVWDEDITIIGNTSATITPEFVAGSSISLESADAVGIRNGDAIRVSNTGGLTGWQTGTDYYARVSGTTLNLYTTNAQSLVGGNTGLIDAGGFAFSGVELTATRQEVTRNLGQARDVIEAVLLDTEALHPAPTTEQITTAVWDADERTITGGVDVATANEIAEAVSNLSIENGYSLQDALQILLAVAAGRLSITNNGGTFTFKRLDADETDVIRSSVTESGRSTPERDPT